MTEASTYQKAILLGLNKWDTHVYGGTVPYEVTQKRRNRAAKASRKINRKG